MNSDERDALVKEYAFKLGEELNGKSPNATVARIIKELAELRIDLNYLLEF